MSRAGCHGCAYEWADACDRLGVHFPSDNPECESCRLNANRKVLATGDHYKTVREWIEEVMRHGGRSIE